MKKISIFVVFLFFTFILSSQNPVLVEDFTAGPDDTFEGNYRGANGADFAVLLTDSPEHGREPMFIKDGEITLMNIVSDGSSWPSSFITIDGYVYFASDNETGGSIIWKTDGTIEGSIKIFEDEGSWVGTILETDSGEIYFTIVEKLYKVTGDTAEFIADNVYMEDLGVAKGSNYTNYKSHFAFLRKGSELELVEFDGTNLNVLGTTPVNFISSVHGLDVVDGGMVFHISDFASDQVEGVYAYVESSGEIVKKDLPVTDSDPRIAVNLNKESQIYLFYSDGWFTVDANGTGEKEIFQDEAEYAFSNFDYHVKDDKIIYISSDPFGSDATFSISDGTKAGTSVLFSPENTYFSTNFLEYKDFVIFGDGVSNGFKANIYWVNPATEEWGKIYQFTGGVVNGQNFNPVFVDGARFYFIAEVDPEIGAEIYYMDHEFFATNSTSDSDDLSELDIQYFDNSLEVQTENTSDLHIEIYDASGRLAQKIEGQTNESISFEVFTGAMIFRFAVEGKIYSEVKFIR